MSAVILFTARFLRQFRLKVDPLAPDRGGWGAIGAMFSMTMVICFALGGIALGMAEADRWVGLNPLDYFEMRVLIGLYVVLLPTAVTVLLTESDRDPSVIGGLWPKNSRFWQ